MNVSCRLLKLELSVLLYHFIGDVNCWLMLIFCENINVGGHFLTRESHKRSAEMLLETNSKAMFSRLWEAVTSKDFP